MKKTILLFLVFASFTVFGQQDTTTIFQTPKGFFKEEIRFKWKKKIEQREDGLWLVLLYDKKNVLQEQISFEDKNLEVRKGAYALYKNGFIEEEGNYSRGYKVGEWKTYLDKLLYDKKNYVWGKLNGLYQAYWGNNQLKETGNYFNDKKVGEYITYYKNGKAALKELYTEEEKSISREYFDAEGNSIEEFSLIQPPIYPGGMAAFNKWLSTEIRYPTIAAKNNIQGTVMLRFTVKKDGTLDNIVAIESPDDELSYEAIRVLKKSKGWMPGMYLGELINVKYNVPVKFNLR